MEGDSLIESCPWLLLEKKFHTFWQNTAYRSIIDYIEDKHVLGYCCDWLVVKDEQNIHCIINVKSLDEIRIPTPKKNYTKCVLTRPPTHPDCHILFMTYSTILCCQPGDKKYKTYRVKKGMRFKHNLVAVVEGKVYYVPWLPFSRYNLVRIECNKSTLQFTKIDMLPFSYNVKLLMSPVYCSYLVESGGELFLVLGVSCILHPKEYGMETHSFLVLRVDLINKSWVQVHDIGKSTIFYGHGSIVGAKDPRIKQNSIYSTLDGYVIVYDLKHDSFSIVPNELKMVNIQEESDENLDYENQNIKFLPQVCSDASKFVLARLFTIDPGAIGLIRSTCKGWGNIIRPPVSDIDLKYYKYPHLVTLTNDKCNFFHPTYNHTFSLDTPEILGSYICSAKFGWLLLSRPNNETRKHEFFFFNPFKKKNKKISILEPDDEDERLLMSFSSPPTSSNCFVVAVGFVGARIGIYKCGEDRWTFIPINLEARVLNHQPVFHKHKCYFVGANKRLVVVDLNTRKIFEIGSGKKFLKDPAIFEECFLVGDGKALLGIFIFPEMNIPPRLMRMDLSQNIKEWQPLQNFNNKMVYVGRAACLSVSAPSISTGNKIYFPLLQNSRCIFYSPSTRKYHSFSGNYSYEIPFEAERMTNCAWIDVE